MLFSGHSTTRVISKIICTLMLLVSLVSSLDILTPLYPATKVYGELPDVRKLMNITAADDPLNILALYTEEDACGGYFYLRTGESRTIEVTHDLEICSVFLQTSRDSRLRFELHGLKLADCEDEYLYLNDGVTMETTLCDQTAAVTSQISRDLVFQYGRQIDTGTAFNFTVSSVSVQGLSPGVVQKSSVVQESFVDEQICPACGRPGAQVKRGRVLGGFPASVTEYPWMVGVHRLQRRSNSTTIQAVVTGCGASILDRRHVLTAAHCVESAPNSPLNVEDLFIVAGSDLGRDDQKNDLDAQKIPVKSWFSHPLYKIDDEGGKSYDVAVLELAEDLEFNERVSPVCLAAPVDFIGSDAIVTGYGMILGGSRAKRLQQVKLTISPGKECHEMYRHADKKFHFHSHQVCLSARSKDACAGDSGGPAIVYWKGKFYQIGVVSFGLNCEHEVGKRHGGYTRVSSFTPWIKAVIAKRGAKC